MLLNLSSKIDLDYDHCFSVHSMAILGYKRPLKEKDLWSLNEDDTSKVVVGQLQKEWDKQKADCNQ